MFKADALNRVMQLYVDTQIVGVEFKFIARTQPAILGDVHDQSGDGPVN